MFGGVRMHCISKQLLFDVLENIEIFKTDEYAYRLGQQNAELFIRDQIIITLQKKMQQNFEDKMYAVQEWKRHDISVHRHAKYRTNPQPMAILELKDTTVGWVMLEKAQMKKDLFSNDIKKLLASFTLFESGENVTKKYHIISMRFPQRKLSNEYNEIIYGFNHHNQGLKVIESYKNIALEQLLEEKISSYYEELLPAESKHEVTVKRIEVGKAFNVKWDYYFSIMELK
jgi:hypothetical protein